MWSICHVIQIFELETSLLMRGIQIGEMSKLGWLIGLVKHAIWVNSLYFLYLLLSISNTLASFQPTLWLSFMLLTCVLWHSERRRLCTFLNRTFENAAKITWCFSYCFNNGLHKEKHNYLKFISLKWKITFGNFANRDCVLPFSILDRWSRILMFPSCLSVWPLTFSFSWVGLRTEGKKELFLKKRGRERGPH
jgi:hypothetical protein